MPNIHGNPTLLEHCKHGDKLECPTCFAPGTLNTKADLDVMTSIENPIWWSKEDDCWVCAECWLK